MRRGIHNTTNLWFISKLNLHSKCFKYPQFILSRRGYKEQSSLYLLTFNTKWGFDDILLDSYSRLFQYLGKKQTNHAYKWLRFGQRISHSSLTLPVPFTILRQEYTRMLGADCTNGISWTPLTYIAEVSWTPIPPLLSMLFIDSTCTHTTDVTLLAKELS